MSSIRTDRCSISSEEMNESPRGARLAAALVRGDSTDMLENAKSDAEDNNNQRCVTATDRVSHLTSRIEVPFLNCVNKSCIHGGVSGSCKIKQLMSHTSSLSFLNTLLS